jgi:hypothetical protein
MRCVSVRLVDQLRAEILDRLAERFHKLAEDAREDAAEPVEEYSIEAELQAFKYSRLLDIQHSRNTAEDDGKLLLRFDDGDIIFDANGGIAIHRGCHSFSTKVGNL